MKKLRQTFANNDPWTKRLSYKRKMQITFFKFSLGPDFGAILSILLYFVIITAAVLLF